MCTGKLASVVGKFSDLCSEIRVDQRVRGKQIVLIGKELVFRQPLDSHIGAAVFKRGCHDATDRKCSFGFG